MLQVTVHPEQVIRASTQHERVWLANDASTSICTDMQEEEEG